MSRWQLRWVMVSSCLFLQQTCATYDESVDERAADETVPLELDAPVEMAAATEVMDPVDEAAAEEEAELLEAEVEAVVAAAVEPPVTEN